MKRIWLFLLFFLCLSKEGSSLSSWGFDLSSGIILGTVKDSSPSTPIEYPFGGMPFYLGFSKDVSKWLTLSLTGQFIVDLSNIRISRFGLDLGLNVYILGGAKYVNYSYEYFNMVLTNSYGLSFVISSGFYKYGAFSRNASGTLEGDVLDTKTGIQFRYDIDQASILIGVFYTVYSLPIGSKTLSSSLLEYKAGVGVSL